jgi:hypothetical protein
MIEQSQFEKSGQRIRKSGGRRKRLENEYPELPSWIEAVVSDETYGNLENPLVWTTKPF